MGAKQSATRKYQPSDSKPEVLRVLKYLGEREKRGLMRWRWLDDIGRRVEGSSISWCAWYLMSLLLSYPILPCSAGSLLDSYGQPFEGRRLGFAVMGISGLSSDVPEVQELVGKIALRAKDAWGEISSQELSMCLHGMAGMQSDSANVRSLISALIPLVKKCNSMTANDVRSAMYGFQGMHSSSKEVNEFIGVFADLLERSNVQFATSYDASTALYSMQGLSGAVPSNKRLLGLIAGSLNSVQGKYEGRDISMSLYGLRDFSSNENETRQVITALGPYIRDFKGSLNVQNVAGAFQGLQKMKSGVCA
jgi:hypothetical protein